MPNFDLFERILIDCLIGIIQPREAAHEICNLPEEQKVSLVKNRRENDILLFLVRCVEALRSRFSPNSKFSSSANNMIGNDIYDSITDTHVEIKSGSQMTDANCGLAIVSWALSDGSDFIKENMTAGMKERRAIYMGGENVEDIALSKNRQMDALSDFLIQQTQAGVGAKLSYFFKSISRGITKGGEIITNYGESEPANFPLKLMCNWDDGLVEYDKAFYQEETILLGDVGRTRERCHLNVVGECSGIRGKLYPHYKNSFKFDDGDRIPAEHWVQTACFHVWISAPGS